MRKLVVANMMSLDGYYTGPDGDVMVLPDYDSFDRYNAERLEAADTLLLGRTSYEAFKSFWPPVAEDPTPPRRTSGSPSATTRSTRWSSRTR